MGPAKNMILPLFPSWFALIGVTNFLAVDYFQSLYFQTLPRYLALGVYFIPPSTRYFLFLLGGGRVPPCFLGPNGGFPLQHYFQVNPLHAVAFVNPCGGKTSGLFCLSPVNCSPYIFILDLFICVYISLTLQLIALTSCGGWAS